jgi:hypothetical protein
MLLDALLDHFQRLQSFFAVTRQHIERQLGVETSIFSFWKDSTPTVCCWSSSEPALAAFAGGLEHVQHRPADARGFANASQKHRQGDGAGCAMT